MGQQLHFNLLKTEIMQRKIAVMFALVMMVFANTRATI